GRPAKQEVAVQARHAPFAQRAHGARHCRGAHHRRDPPSAPRQPDRLLPRPQGAQDQERRL
ncbi:MAG: LSU ribosomal protein L32p @ LSU ribosomal protein L32p, zinc-independent, partial [uncultured Ramlibacter sp.]